MVDDARAGVHERHAGVQRRRLVRPRLRLPARPAHARARPRLGRELDRDRRRPRVDPRVDAVGRPLGRRQHARRTRPTTSGRTRRTAATTPSPSAAPRWTRTATSTTRRSGRTSRRRCASRAAAGWPTSSCMIPLIYLWSTTHDPRTFVERLDFRSGIGWGDGGDHRERLGLPGGPQLCVTNLCVFDFHPDSKRMQIRSLHPGVTAEQVIEATGFELALPDGDLPVTAEPDRGGAPDPARGRRPDRRAPAGVPMSRDGGLSATGGRRVGATDVIEADAPAIRELADRIAGAGEGRRGCAPPVRLGAGRDRLRHGAGVQGRDGLARDRDARARRAGSASRRPCCSRRSCGRATSLPASSCRTCSTTRSPRPTSR